MNTLSLGAIVAFLVAAGPETRATPAPAKPGRVLTKQAPCKPAEAEELVRLDFDNAPVRDLVTEVGRVLCKNFVLDPRLAHQPVFVVSGAETRVGALWAAFLSILAANELTVVEDGGYFAIIPSTDATRENIPTYGPRDPVPNEARMVTKVFAVGSGDINATANFLNIYKSGKGQIHPFGPAGILVMTDYGSSIARVEWILAQISKPAK